MGLSFDSLVKMIPQDQLSFLSNKESFLLKSRVDLTVNQLLYLFQNSISNLLSKGNYTLPTKLSKLPSKVTKGNNHKGFPFQVSDYPATFNQVDVFSFRSTVWYGHFFSFSLILSGNPKRNYNVDIRSLTDKDYRLVTNEAIWETDHPNALDITQAQTSTLNKLIEKSERFKIFKVYDLNHICDFERLGVECFEELFSMN